MVLLFSFSFYYSLLEDGNQSVNDDPILAINDPTLITPQQAEQFVNSLHNERMNMKTMREDLCRGLAHLGAELYSSQVFNNNNNNPF